MMLPQTVLSFAVMLLSMGPPAPLQAIDALIVVLTCTLLVRGVGFVVRSAWYALKPDHLKSIERAWRFFRRGVLGTGAVVWLVLTLGLMQQPAGRGNERAAEANMRTINTAEVTYFYTHDRKWGDIFDLIAAGLLDDRFPGPVSVYIFTVTVSEQGYTTTGIPFSTNTGKYGYSSSNDAVVRYATSSTDTCKPCYPRGQSGQPVR